MYFFYLTLLNGDSPPGGVKIHIRQPGDRDGTSSVVSSRIWVFCRSHDLHANSLAIVMGHLSLSYRLLGSFRSFIMEHEPSINDRMSVSRLFKGYYGYKSNMNWRPHNRPLKLSPLQHKSAALLVFPLSRINPIKHSLLS